MYATEKYKTKNVYLPTTKINYGIVLAFLMVILCNL